MSGAGQTCRRAVFLPSVSHDVSRVPVPDAQVRVWQELQDVRNSISELEEQKKTVSKDVRRLVVSMAPPIALCIH